MSPLCPIPPRLIPGRLICGLALALPLTLHAEDAPATDPTPEPPRWATTGKVGAFGSSVLTSNSDTSRDPSIAGASETLAYRLSLEAGLVFREGKHAVDHALVAKYGRKKDEDTPWLEDTDEVRYDGVYRHLFHQPHFGFASWGWESVFTGPEPERDPFTPGLLKASLGYGQLFEDFWSVKSKAEGRLGASVRKRYGDSLTSADKETETGLEVYLRLEHQRDARLRYFAQYEGFAEFEDIGHVINLITAGVTANLSQYLTLEVGLRAHYETRPDDRTKAAGDGYNAWSVRQDTLLGLTYTW